MDSTRAGRPSICAKSQGKPVASIPNLDNDSTARLSSAGLRATSATWLPSSPRLSAIRRPSRREPPVTTATFPVRSNKLLTDPTGLSLGIAAIHQASCFTFLADVRDLGERALGNELHAYAETQIVLQSLRKLRCQVFDC